MSMQRPRPRAEATLQVDTERVRVTLWRFAPGAETGWHRHAHDYVVVPLTTGTLAIEGPDGAATRVDLAAGGSYARGLGVAHNVVNASEGDFAFVEIELK